MKKKKNILFFLYTVIFILPLNGQLAYDTLLFTIPLINNASDRSLFNIHRVKWVRQALSGPVVMKDDNLLFYSNKGYVLFDQQGSIVDSHSVFKDNEELPRNDSNRITLAFPVDDNSILFYKNIPHEQYPLTIFKKKFFRRIKNPLKDSEYDYYKGIRKRHVYNIAFNTLTDEMRERYFVIPRLVGFTSLSSSDKWWSVDKIYSFISPMVNEQDGEYRSLFPGIHLEKEKNRIQTIEPLQIFTREDRWFYTGISAGGVSPVKGRHFQTYFVFDQAGNELYADTLLMQDDIDAIIGEDEENYYTMLKVKRKVFKPSVCSSGDLFYGIIDYKLKRIEVRKRPYYVYKAFSCAPALNELIDNEKCVEFVPVNLDCSRKSTGKPAIPRITLQDEETKKFVKAKARHLTKGGYICHINRTFDRGLKKKLARGKGGVSRNIRGILHKLSNDPLVTCPYTISLEGSAGVIRTFSYPPGEEIVCARIMALHKSDELLIRVDCRTYAEALIFKTDGSFVNRFVFNRQNYENRLDIIVSSENSPIIELDYESNPETHTYLQWRRCLNN